MGEVAADPAEVSSGAGPGAGTLELPEVPVPPGEAIVVDFAGLEELACEHCAAAAQPDAVRFVFADLARVSVDAVCSSPPDVVPSLLGNMHVSGYLGGVWFRDQVAGGLGGDGGGADASVLRVVARSAGNLTRSMGASDGQVLRAVRGQLAWLLLLYGYNRAYLDVVLDNPPDGSTVPEDAVLFRGLLDTEVPSFPLEAADAHAGVPGKIASPPTADWAVLGWLTRLFLSSGASGGRGVWDAILRAGDFTPQTYSAVVDLSAGFLLVAEAAVRAALDALGEDDPVAGRCALGFAATLLVWAGSYFAGLVSPLPEGTQPWLDCTKAP